MNKQAIRRNIINHIIRIEGGYVDDKADSGGKTKYGITEAVARANGIADVRTITAEQAFAIYEKDYWHPVGADELLPYSEQVAAKLFDIAVNMGVGRAAEFLQVTLNGLNQQQTLYPDVKVDRDVGEKTLSAARRFFAHRGQKGGEVLLKALNALQGYFYISLAQRRPKDQRFLYGWLDKRVGLPELRTDTAPIASPPSPPVNIPTPEDKPMYTPMPSPHQNPIQQPPDGYVTDDITGQQLPYWNTQRERFRQSPDAGFSAWVKQESEKARRMNSKPSWKSKLVGTGLTMAGAGVATFAARYGLDVDPAMLADVASYLLLGGGSAVVVLRKWFTSKFLF